MRINYKINHSYIYLTGLILLAIAMPFSNFLMSIAQIILLANWIAEGRLKEKFQLFLKNKTAVILSGVFIIHVVGLFYTSNLDYGLEDVKKKIPLLLLPLILSTSPKISKRQLQRVLWFFLFSVAIATLISTLVYVGIMDIEITDIRQISVFISHIRFSLMICFAFFIAIYFFRNNPGKWTWAYMLATIWFFAFLVLMESLTGLIALSLGLLFIFFKWISNQPKKYKVPGFILIGILILLPAAFIALQIKGSGSTFNALKFKQLEAYTVKGEQYFHDMQSQQIENGNYVRLYIAINELKETWNKRSKIDFDSTDRKGHYIEYTIIRFLTSKGLRKDAEGVNALSDEEILAIENGIANFEYQEKSSLADRIRKVIWEIDWYMKGYNPSGHSFTMRLEYWKAALSIIKKNILTGVGTGDPPTEFTTEYKHNNTQLDKEWWHRSHNQFLAITVALGLMGLSYFLFSLVYPFLNESNRKNYFYLVFFIIAVFSMFSEDTLETQAGVTFYAFFNSLLLFSKEEN